MHKIIHKILGKQSYGQISLALFMICIISGIVLAIPYDVGKAYESISLLMLSNPSANLFRNIHYWSAQLFLVFSLLHLWEHFKRRSKIKVNASLWFRLSLGVLIIFLVMLTGFLLKGDADSLQARRILNELIIGLPFIGELISYSLLGPKDSLQLIYVHHIATLSIFIAIIIIEHAKTIWPRLGPFLSWSLLVIVLSILFTAPLHDNLNPVIKGPWYFVGLQELLHWMSAPLWSLALVFGILILVYIIPFIKGNSSILPKRTLLIVTMLYLGISIFAYFFRGPNWTFIYPGNENYGYHIETPFNTQLHFFDQLTDTTTYDNYPTIMDRKESCMVCHSEMVGFAASHDPSAVGCYSCHGGDLFTLDKDASHKGMVNIPGNLADAKISCGTANCHPDISSRIETGLMATLSGMISVDRYVFNEAEHPDIRTHVNELGSSAADEHLRNMCVRCHLGNPKESTGPITQESRGGGCLACHLNYDALAVTAWHEHEKNPADTGYLNYHPTLNMQVSDEHCFGCHSRSGRIATNYEGWHETKLAAAEMPNTETYRLVENHRVFTYIQEDVHHKLGLNCIDCHNSYELMGDGNLYTHQEDQLTIQCADCHSSDKPQTINQQDLDRESALIASMRFGFHKEREFLLTAKKQRPLVNTYMKGDSAFMIGKNNKQTYGLSKPAAICTKGESHDRISCSACHSNWAPSCIGCHNIYDPNEPGYDMVANVEKQGSWVEFIGEYQAHLPALGTRITGNDTTVIPVVPGMVLTIDVGSYSKTLHDSLIFQRLFAPAAPHTTVKEGRSCISCHNNPVALGFGKGELVFNKEGRWKFEPAYQDNPNDGLPEDSWIPFLGSRKGKVSTRSNVQPFSIAQQQRILSVGACLSCHEQESSVMEQSLVDFEAVLKARSPQCRIAVW